MTRPLLLLLLTAFGPAAAQENPFTKPGPAPMIVPVPVEKDPSVGVFKPDFKLPVVQITVDDDALKVLNKQPKKYIRCDVKMDGKAFRDVGIHLKGAVGSFRQWNDKPALTLNLDKFVNGQAFRGLDKFHLNNSVQDGSYMNELTCSLLASALGVPTARTTHAVVELNGRKVGIYVLKEGYNANFVRRNFPTGTHGHLYDGGFCTDIDAKLKLDYGEGEDRDDLKAIIKACQTKGDAAAKYEAVAKLVDVELFVRDAALQNVIGDWDGYMRNRNNYRVYIPPGAQAVWIPHGMDQEFQNPGDNLFHGYGGMVANVVANSKEGRGKIIAAMKEISEKHLTPEFFKLLGDYAARTRDALVPYNKDWAKQFENEAKQQATRLKQRAEFVAKELPKLK